MGDAVLAKGLVETFVASIGKCLRDLEAGLAGGDQELLRRAAHTVVGASANLGAARLEAVAIQVEAAAKRGDLAAVRDLLPSLQKRFASASSTLEKF